MMGKSLWMVINDNWVRHVWECPECDDRAYVEPWFYSEMGEPFCANCEKDMEYVRTELNVGEYKGHEIVP